MFPIDFMTDSSSSASSVSASSATSSVCDVCTCKTKYFECDSSFHECICKEYRFTPEVPKCRAPHSCTCEQQFVEEYADKCMADDEDHVCICKLKMFYPGEKITCHADASLHDCVCGLVPSLCIAQKEDHYCTCSKNPVGCKYQDGDHYCGCNIDKRLCRNGCP